MGIKMGYALDQNGVEWDAQVYQKGQGAEPLKCEHCGVNVTHNPPYPKEIYEKPVLVSGYFRLYPKRPHSEGCRFGIDSEIVEIAKTSDGLIQSLRNNRYRMRLVMIKEALEEASKSKSNGGGESRAGTGKTYASSSGRLPAYINSAKRALKLRAACTDDQDLQEHLELVFEGNVNVAWSQFYFEAERHMEAFHAVSQNTVQHPIAIQGRVKDVRYAIQGVESKNVINLLMNRFRADSEDPANGIGLEVSIWASDPSWFKGIERDNEILVLGMWRANTKAPTPAPPGGRYKTFTTRRLTLTLFLKTQVSKV